MEPILVGVSPAVRADAERGLEALPSEDGANAITELFDAVALGDQVSAAITVRLHWSTVYDLAYAGIAERLAAGEIGPNGAKSFEKRVEEYGARLFQWIGD